jgi:hypothetical protein
VFQTDGSFEKGQFHAAQRNSSAARPP